MLTHQVCPIFKQHFWLFHTVNYNNYTWQQMDRFSHGLTALRKVSQVIDITVMNLEGQSTIVNMYSCFTSIPWQSEGFSLSESAIHMLYKPNKSIHLYTCLCAMCLCLYLFILLNGLSFSLSLCLFRYTVCKNLCFLIFNRPI